MSTKEILQKARDLLTPETWGKKGQTYFGNKTCAGQAIYRAAGTERIEQALPPLRALAMTLGHSRPDDGAAAFIDEIILFNDAHETTLEMVHAKFDEAIAALP